MYSEYFKAKVISKETKQKTFKERIGLFTFKEKSETIYFLNCKIESTDFEIRIEVDKNVYDVAQIDDSLSIHLKFDYEFSCFHFMPTTKTTKVLNFKDKY